MNYRQPSTRKSMHTTLVQDLGLQIVSGQLAPGQKLPNEASLCESYAISRPVFREAMRALTAKGLVEARPGSVPWCGRAMTGTCLTQTCCTG